MALFIKESRKRFNVYMKRWEYECSGKKDLTIHRKNQLLEVLALYPNNKISYFHFSKYKNKVNNMIYPLICACILGYFNIEKSYIELKEEYKTHLKQI